MRSLGKRQIAWIAIFVLLVISFGFLVPDFKDRAFGLTMPLQQGLREGGLKTSQFFQGMFSAKDLRRENDELRLRLASLLYEVNELGRVRLENAELQQALAPRKANRAKLLPVKILGKELMRDVLFLDQGKEAGIASGQVVVAASQEAVGIIEEAAANFSKVRLISDKGFVIDISIPEKEITAVTRGQGGLEVSLDLVPREKNLQAGDLLFTSHLGGVFPSGLLIGAVEDVQLDDASSFQQARVRPVADVRASQLLFVILSVP